uniref:C2H2-type domain-containing protein n=1 Tax=Mesocestoides corti TaxID=53468 RepID=A0A5K3EU58_MESCO
MSENVFLPANFRCVYCLANFPDSKGFWDHMSVGSCKGVEAAMRSDQTPAPKDGSSPAVLPSPTTEECGSSFVDPPCSSSLSSPSISSHSVFKCTLCNIRFKDKVAMMAHVKSREHEEKIQAASITERTQKKMPTAPNLEQQQISPSPPPTLRSNIADLVRKIAKEELPAVLRNVFQEILNAIPVNACEQTTSRPVRDAMPSEHVASNEMSEIIEYQGSDIWCKICKCRVPSEVNLPAHLRGKKHKSALEKFNSCRR